MKNYKIFRILGLIAVIVVSTMFFASCTLSFVDNKDEQQIVYGDVTDDGEVNTKDILRIRKYLDQIVTVSEINEKNADVDLDEVVTFRDYKILNAFWNGTITTLPYTGDYTDLDMTVYGDINEDGLINRADYVLLRKALAGTETLSEQALLNADLEYGSSAINQDDLDRLADYLACKIAWSEIRYQRAPQ